MTKNTGVILSAVATTNQTAASASRPPREARIPSRTRTKITSLTCTRLKLLRKNWAVKTTATASGGQAGLRSGNVRATISRVSQAATTHSAMLRSEKIVAATCSGSRASTPNASAANGGDREVGAPGGAPGGRGGPGRKKRPGGPKTEEGPPAARASPPPARA